MSKKDALIFNIKLGHSLRAIRKNSKISQITLCKILRVHQAALSRIENGSQQLTAYQLSILSEVFGSEFRHILINHILFEEKK